MHRNKPSLTIDLKNPQGHELFMTLACEADVIVENFRADVKHRLGVDYESVKVVNPRIVYGSISGFGHDGPYQKRPGVNQITQALDGLMSITGFPEQGPVRVGIPITDLCAGMFLAQGILLALLQREHTGEGQWVHTSLLESMCFMLDFQASRWLQAGEVPKQAGNDHPTSVPQGCYRTADGLINMAAPGAMFKRFCDAVEAPQLLENPDYQSAQSRSNNRRQLNKEIEAILATKPSVHWVQVLNDAGVPCGPVNRVDQTFSDPQVHHLNVVRQVEHPRLGTLDVVRQPVNLSSTTQPQRFRHPAPDTGQHTEDILRQVGISDVRIAQLRHAGAI